MESSSNETKIQESYFSNQDTLTSLKENPTTNNKF